MLGIQPAEMLCFFKAISIVALLLSVAAVPWLSRLNNELRVVQTRLNLC